MVYPRLEKGYNTIQPTSSNWEQLAKELIYRGAFVLGGGLALYAIVKLFGKNN